MKGRNFSKKEDLDPFLDSNFTKLFNDLYSPLCRYCISLVGDKEMAEDIVQEQFIYIWDKRERLGISSSIRSYLFTAVKHRSINYLRKQFLRNSDFCTENFSENELIGTLPDPANILENKELGEILDQALTNLPEKCRIIFTMKKIGELTNKEIALKLKISVKTVENQMTIAFKKLIGFISEHWK